jgi:hypothetical protein
MITPQIRVHRFRHVSTVRPVFSTVLIVFPSLVAINANFLFDVRQECYITKMTEETLAQACVL